jgi:hypothetical protein
MISITNFKLVNKTSRDENTERMSSVFNKQYLFGRFPLSPNTYFVFAFQSTLFLSIVFFVSSLAHPKTMKFNLLFTTRSR